ncbi:MAG: hypothetical protein EBT09_05530, partial [Actinobacteria bacterium]|nr:hypothetical protein [Actinomycetota bacterium]
MLGQMTADGSSSVQKWAHLDRNHLTSRPFETVEGGYNGWVLDGGGTGVANAGVARGTRTVGAVRCGAASRTVDRRAGPAGARIAGVHLRGVPPMLSGDVRELFDVLYGDLSGEVIGHAKRLMRGGTLDALSVEDVAQTVWLKVWANLERAEHRPGHGRHDGLRSWVHTITRN